MQFIVYCVRYTDRGWKKHRHVCSDQENEAVVDSAKAYALMRFPDQKLTFSDYLAGARYMFDVAFGPRDQPVIGDTVVTGLKVSHDSALIAHFRNLLASGRLAKRP